MVILGVIAGQLTVMAASVLIEPPSHREDGSNIEPQEFHHFTLYKTGPDGGLILRTGTVENTIDLEIGECIIATVTDRNGLESDFSNPVCLLDYPGSPILEALSND